MVRAIILIGVAALVGAVLGNQMVAREVHPDEFIVFKRGFSIAGYVVSQDDASRLLIVRVDSSFPGEATSTRDMAVVYDAATNWLDTMYLLSDGIIVQRVAGTSTKKVLPSGALVYVTVVHPANSTQLYAQNIIIQRREDI